MYTEDELRTMLANDASSRGGTIDTALVIRRSGRRRHARTAVVGGATTLAVLGIGAAAVAGVRTLGGTSSSTSVAVGQSATTPDTKSSVEGGAAAGGQPQAGLKRAAAEKLNLCGGALASVAPNAAGLVLTTQFPATAAAASTSITGKVTLTNTGLEHIVGTTAASPAITLSRDGVTIWHSNGPMIAMVAVVDLAPGASMTYQASFSPVVCSVEDDSAASFREGLPQATPGDYSLSAAIDLSRTSADGTFLSNELVTGPLSAITLG
jgi:hypothetical protein